MVFASTLAPFLAVVDIPIHNIGASLNSWRSGGSFCPYNPTMTRKMVCIGLIDSISIDVRYILYVAVIIGQKVKEGLATSRSFTTRELTSLAS